MLDMEIEKQRPNISEHFQNADVALTHASAFIGLGANLNLLDRYETRVRRSYERATKNLHDLRARRHAGKGQRENNFLPNEPKTPCVPEPTESSV